MCLLQTITVKMTILWIMKIVERIMLPNPNGPEQYEISGKGFLNDDTTLLLFCFKLS